MRAVRGPAPRRMTPEELAAPLETLKGVSRVIVDDVLDRYGLLFHGYANLNGIQAEINTTADHIGYAAALPDGSWALMVFRYQTPDAPEPTPRSRAIRLH